MMSEFDDIRRECSDANRRLPGLGLVDLTFGNVSVADREKDVIAIKPSGIPYDALRPEDIVIVRLSGSASGAVVEGSLRPSSDTSTHRRLLQAFPRARAVVHTHSRNATAFAQAGRSVPCLGTTHADFFHGEIPITRAMTPAEVNGEYEWQSGEVIVERFADLDFQANRAVLLRGHGPFAWGASGEEALEVAFALELVAELALKTLSLNPGSESLPRFLLDKHYLRKHGADAYYGQRAVSPEP
jgi:L-ribulose-5-phosphate 4-epimerase